MAFHSLRSLWKQIQKKKDVPRNEMICGFLYMVSWCTLLSKQFHVFHVIVPYRPPIIWTKREKQTRQWEGSSPWVVVIISVKKPTATLKMHLHSTKAAKEATLQTHTEKQRGRERTVHRHCRKWQTESAECKQPHAQTLETYTSRRFYP